MAPGVSQMEDQSISAVKRISSKECIESVCHVGAGSPPKPTPLNYVKPRKLSAADEASPGPMELKVPGECRRRSSDGSVSPRSTETRSVKTKAETKQTKLSPAPRERKLSQSSASDRSPGHSPSRNLLHPEPQRRATVGTCSAEKSPLVRARKTFNKRKEDDTYSRTSSNSNLSLPHSNSQELHEYQFDPVKVTNLDIDTGAYIPDPEHVNFLRKALSESPNPFAKEEIRERVSSFSKSKKVQR